MVDDHIHVPYLIRCCVVRCCLVSTTANLHLPSMHYCMCINFEMCTVFLPLNLLVGISSCLVTICHAYKLILAMDDHPPCSIGKPSETTANREKEAGLDGVVNCQPNPFNGKLNMTRPSSGSLEGQLPCFCFFFPGSRA